jgi:hypothetical protein
VGKPEAVAVHLEDMDVMREAVEERAGEPLGAEHGCPLIERQIARDQRAALLVALTAAQATMLNEKIVEAAYKQVFANSKEALESLRRASQRLNVESAWQRRPRNSQS